MSRRAVSGSQRCIITSLNFMPKQESITGTHPVTWNSGTMRMKHGANAPPVPSGVLALAGGLDGGVAPEPHQAVDHGPVGRDGTLGEPGGPRRVEDGGVVVGADLDLGHRVAELDHLVVAGHAGRVRLELVAPHHDHRHAPGVGRGVGPLDPLGIGDQQRQAGVLDGVVELGLGPPGVERDRHGADRQDGGERDDPLGEVAHGDPHPVALAGSRRCGPGRGPGRRRCAWSGRRSSARPRRPGTRTRRPGPRRTSGPGWPGRS